MITVNVNKLMSRWKHAYSLIFNVHYYNFNPLVFGSFFFKNEIQAINWPTMGVDHSMWKYNYPFFTYRTNRFSKKLDFFFAKLLTFEIDFVFLIDPVFHYKNLYYFKRHNFYTISLIDMNLNPWLVDYAIPVCFNNYLVQFFFLKTSILLNKNAQVLKFNFLKTYWFFFNYKSNFSI
jgi:hypothetical protein